jgi:hypothetical protein
LPTPSRLSFDPAMIFPAERTLARPEDGVALADGPPRSLRSIPRPAVARVGRLQPPLRQLEVCRIHTRAVWNRGGRERRFRVDVAAGTVSQRELALDVTSPDNLTLDRAGRLWIASSLRSEIVVFDPGTRTAESFFRIATAAGEALIAAIEAKVRSGEPFPFDAFTPVVWQPAPGMLTGVILATDEKYAYVTTLGNALIRLPYRT